MSTRAKIPARTSEQKTPKDAVRPAIGIGLPLDSAKRRDLKGRAHGLEPVVMISAKSAALTEPVAAEIDRALEHHELVKIRVLGDDRAVRSSLLDAICARTGAAPVQHIGKVLVIYRPRPAAA